MTTPKITALASWFGSNRSLAHEVGQALEGCTWVGVPFAGGMSELLHITARTMLVSDLHRHVINLAMVVADDILRPLAVKRLKHLPFHPDVLAMSQDYCRAWAGHPMPNWEAAVEYFVTVWMGRASRAGTRDEFKGGVSLRWEAGGGDSMIRFRSAVRSLTDWRLVTQRCSFCVMDVFEFLECCQDATGHGLYCDPPFPGPGEQYQHQFTIEQQHRLAHRLARFQKTRVVCRFYDVPLVHELYPEGHWTWLRFAGRNQKNDVTPEVLITNQRPGGLFT